MHKSLYLSETISGGQKWSKSGQFDLRSGQYDPKSG